MKIVQVNTVCDHGSIPKIMLTLYNAAEQNGNESYLAYGRRKAPNDVRSFRIDRNDEVGLHILRNFILGQSGFGSRKATLRFIAWLQKVQPDLLHLHNLHGFYLQVELFMEYIREAHIPVIWTLHDTWAYTGQCAYYSMADCSKWKTLCHDCPIYRTSYPYSLFRDNSTENYVRKKMAFQGIPYLCLVTPSIWLKNEVCSSFLSSYPVHVIPTGINADIYREIPNARKTLGKRYPLSNKKIILGVANIWETRKGLTFFERLAEDPALQKEYQFILIGLNKKQIHILSSRYQSNVLLPLQKTTSTEELCRFYSAASVFVNPTLEDNFPTTNLEALSCGTPIVSFRTGGSAECIDSTCGIAVERGNLAELKSAIPNAVKLSRISCRQRVLQHYTAELMAKRYLSLYHDFFISSKETKF